MFVLSIVFVVWVLGWWKSPDTFDFKLGVLMGGLFAFAASIIGSNLGWFVGWLVVRYGG